MALFWLLLGMAIGATCGLLYSWFRYHQPEFQEERSLRLTSKRLARIQLEAEIESWRGDIDALLERRLK